MEMVAIYNQDVGINLIELRIRTKSIGYIVSLGHEGSHVVTSLCRVEPCLNNNNKTQMFSQNLVLSY